MVTPRKNNQSSSASLIQAFRYAAQGIASASKGRNFRIELGFFVAAIILGLVCGISAVEWCVVLLFSALVLASETLNTALEDLVDLVSPEFSQLAGSVKDCAAGMVLIFALASFVVGVIIFLPKLLSMVGLG